MIHNRGLSDLHSWDLVEPHRGCKHNNAVNTHLHPPSHQPITVEDSDKECLYQPITVVDPDQECLYQTITVVDSSVRELAVTPACSHTHTHTHTHTQTHTYIFSY